MSSALEEAFSAFCQVYMPGRNFTAATRRGYRYDLAEWFSHVAVSHVKALSTVSIQHYLSQLDAKGLQATTRHRKIAAIKAFLRFLEEQSVLPKDFSNALVWPKVERGEPRPLRPAQYTALLREAVVSPRDLAMFATLLQTGIRQFFRTHGHTVYTLPFSQTAGKKPTPRPTAENLSLAF
jgi:site-specific recombinase XerD